MRTHHPDGDRHEAESSAIQRGLQWLTTNLLLAYLAAITAQQLWALLNSDVKELVRRLH